MLLNFLSRRTAMLLCVALGLAILVSHFAVIVRAQLPGEAWSTPDLLFSLLPGENMHELWLLRDRSDRLYAWWSVLTERVIELGANNVDVPESVFHTEWVEGIWQTPIDVLLWPDAGGLTNVVMDADGLLHVFSATNCLSYVYTWHGRAMDAKAWNKKGCLDGIGNTSVAAVYGPENILYVVYAAPGTQELRLARSDDNGVTWSFVSVVTTQIGDSFFASPALSADDRGRLHLVWSPASPPDGYPLMGVFYTRSDDGGKHWTTPVQLGRDHEGQAAIAVHGDEVHVLWNGDAGKRGRYYRYSSDAGANWEPIEALGSGGGLQRPPAVAIDNVGHVHALLHEQQWLYYVMKDESGWTSKQALYIPGDLDAIELYAVRLAITGGNQLHAVYILAHHGDLNSFTKSIYHQVRTIDAIPVAPSPWPTATTIPLPVSLQPTVSAVPTLRSDVAGYNLDYSPPPDLPLQTLPLIVSFVAVSVLLFGVGVLSSVK